MGLPVAHAQTATPTPLVEAPGAAAPGGDAASSRNAARSRLRECGHQWSSMKKAGSANGMTWKDYSRSCLAKQ